jgi:intracellular sulfur oxidation DsrE/DsrF family protein
MKQAFPSRRSALARSLALAATGVVGASGAATSSASEAAQVAYRAVFQVSDADPMKWQMTLNNVRNAQAELGSDRVSIEIVAFGPGIGMLLASADVAGRLADAAKAGVRVLACENTMRGQKLTPAQMHPQAGSVPSGVAHLIRRQAEAYAYIRS